MLLHTLRRSQFVENSIAPGIYRLVSKEMKDNDLIWIRETRGLPSAKSICANSCDLPWSVTNIDSRGRVFLCRCDGWVPFSVGHVLDFKNFAEVFASTQAQEIQQSIVRGTYDYCDTRYCGVETHAIKNQHDYYVSIGIDDSCNLQCPSCRPEMRFSNDKDFVAERSQWADRINEWIEQEPQADIKVLIGSNGDPFASEVYRHFMRTKMSPRVHYDIRTNGLLIKKHLGSLPVLSNLRQLEISIDAASPDVYHDVRRPGRWSSLKENLDFVRELRQTHQFNVLAFFVIQRANLCDVLPFIDLCESYEMTPGFTLLQDWSSWTNFAEHCVQTPTHPMHQIFLETVHHPRFRALNLDWAQSL